MSSGSTSPADPRPLPIRALKPAYEQVADQLRELILSGTLKSGDRLPTEAGLCQQFGTSRSTIREALRSLSSESLIRTKRGSGGGITVALPTPGDVIAQLDTALSLLAMTGELSAEELFLARRLVEVPAAGMAARAADEDQVELMRSFIPDRTRQISRDELFEHNQAFHETVMLASGNRLLHLMGRPLFTILRRRFVSGGQEHAFHAHVVCDHSEIVDAIAARDAPRAEALMAHHLDNLSPHYRDHDALGGVE